jgi:hypothetical protein
MRAAWVVAVVAVLGVVGCTRVPDPAPMPSASSPSLSASALDALFVCGRGVWVDDLAGTRQGLTMAITSVRYVSDDTGPEVTLRFTATAVLQVRTGRPSSVEVVYLKDSVIVGGGPMLNLPGDFSPQGVDLPGSGFQVAPGQPADVALGPRPTLCPAFTWPKLWSTPADVDVMVVQGQVEQRVGFTFLGVPGPGVPLLSARAGLTSAR